MSQRKDPELDAKHQAILRKMMQLPENKTCADCKGPSPRWASTNLGVFVCIACSGIHRKLGTHISQVRSVTLDTWTQAQVAHFQKLGNAKAAQYFESCIPQDFRRPAAGDSMEMERFIRHKYEHKRFITVENGGLGGEMPSFGPRRTSVQQHVSGVGKTSYPVKSFRSHGGGQYDDFNNRRGNGLPSSYGNKFGAVSPASGQTRKMDYANRGSFNSGRGLGVRPGSALQRAATLKEITNMGFSAQLAARAVEAAEGDLQRAVDWVLQHSATGDPPQAAAPPPPKPQPTAMPDLLDFGDPEPAVGTASCTNAESSERKTTNVMPRPVAQKSEQEGFADFADFGAFERALPTPTEPTVAKLAAAKPAAKHGSTATHGSLSSSIASLYARGPLKSSSRISPPLAASASQMLPQLPKLDSPPHRKTQSVSLQGSLLVSQNDEKISPSRTPLRSNKPSDSIPSFSWPAQSRPAIPPRSDQEAGESQNMSGVSTKAEENKPPETFIPRSPPPPSDDLHVGDSDEVPPPPPGPPPSLRSEEMTKNTTSPKATRRDVHVAQEVESGEDPSSATVAGGEGDPQTVPEIDNEDPFAALSMFALSSASSKKLPAKKANETTLESPAVSAPSSSPVQADATAAPINLDDLFG